MARAFARAGARPPRRVFDGGFAIELACGMVDLAELLASAPRAFETERVEEAPLVDATGSDVDIEQTTGLVVCPPLRAAVAYIDHWQAGLFATLTVFGTQRGFDDAMTRAREHFDARLDAPLAPSDGEGGAQGAKRASRSVA
jgi:hypothetical protein